MKNYYSDYEGKNPSRPPIDNRIGLLFTKGYWLVIAITLLVIGLAVGAYFLVDYLSNTIKTGAYEEGKTVGYNEGYDEGYCNGELTGADAGREEGYNDGYDKGFYAGYNNGQDAAEKAIGLDVETAEWLRTDVMDEWLFYRMSAVIIPEGSNYYHKYNGCDLVTANLEEEGFFIVLNPKYAEHEGFKPCPVCFKAND